MSGGVEFLRLPALLGPMRILITTTVCGLLLAAAPRAQSGEWLFGRGRSAELRSPFGVSYALSYDSNDHDQHTPTFDFEVDHTNSADFSSIAGDYSLTRIDGKFDIPIVDAEDESVLLTLGHEARVFDFSSNTALPGGGSFKDLHRTGLAATYAGKVDYRWYVFGTGRLSALYEPGAKWGDAAQFALFSGAQYLTGQVGLGLGVYFGTRIEDDPWIFPLPLITVRAGRFWLQTSRGIEMEYDLDRDGRLTVGLDVLFDYRRYRLDDSNVVSEGVVEHREVPARLGLEYSPNSSVSIGMRVGANLWQNLRVEDRNGNRLAKSNVDPQVMVGLELELSF